MDIRLSLDGAAGVLVLSLPWLLLMWVAWLSRGSAVGDVRRGAATAEPVGTAAGAGGAPSAVRAGPAAEVRAVSSRDGQAPPVAPTAVADHDPEAALVLAIAAAKASGDDAQLSNSSIELARILIAQAAPDRAAVHLRSAALAARRAKLPDVHAMARIELAELARRDGDMTSACEHWQMAKLMYHEVGQRTEQNRIADLMRQHRCPTDWVLTNF